MTKKNNKDQKRSTLEIWIDEKREQHPQAVQHFESFLRIWGYETIGSAFAQLGKSFEAILLYLNANNAPTPVSSLDPIKSSLEVAFHHSQRVSDELAW